MCRVRCILRYSMSVGPSALSLVDYQLLFIHLLLLYCSLIGETFVIKGRWPYPLILSMQTRGFVFLAADQTGSLHEGRGGKLNRRPWEE